MESDLILRLQELFELTLDGRLIRKTTQSPNARMGDFAGWLDKDGYWRVRVDRKQYLLHRVVYMLYYKESPEFVDHINGDTGDNRPENLRSVTKAQNRWNCTANEGSQSGVKGVYCDRGRWKALINVSGIRYYLGMYSTVAEAEIVVKKKYAELQGEYTKS